MICTFTLLRDLRCHTQIRLVSVHLWKNFVGANVLACYAVLALNEDIGMSVLAFVWLWVYCLGPACFVAWVQWRRLGHAVWERPVTSRWSVLGHVRAVCSPLLRRCHVH